MTPPRIAPELAHLRHVPIDSIEPLQGTLKTLSKREYAKLKKSLIEHGIIVPFFIWREAGKMLDGHQRQIVMINEGWLIDVPIVEISASDEQDAKRKLLVISSQYGRVTEEGWADFTFDLDQDWLMDSVQFDALPIFDNWSEEGDSGNGAGKSQDAEPQTNRADELRQEWGVETGQLWRLPSRTSGHEHRLICGDCTDGEIVARVMGGEKAEMMFTDPPYGVNYTGGHFHSGDVNIKRERPKLANDANSGIYAQFLPVVLPFVDGPCYAWFASSVGKPVFDAIIGNGCEIHAMIIWNKVNATYAAMNAQYKQRHEPCMYFKPKGSTLRWVGASTECTVWDEKRDGQNNYHPTQKPIVLAERAINNHNVQLVFDPFVGSGTTIVAAENLARQCRAIEIAPAYVAVALDRYYRAFNIKPELVGGRPLITS